MNNATKILRTEVKRFQWKNLFKSRISNIHTTQNTKHRAKEIIENRSKEKFEMKCTHTMEPIQRNSNKTQNLIAMIKTGLTVPIPICSY